MSGGRRYLRAVAIVALATETGAALPAHGRLLPDLLGEPDGPDPWTCVRCGGELTAPERYACSACLSRDDMGRPWIGARPTPGRPP
jgi:hypothetical protein